VTTRVLPFVRKSPRQTPKVTAVRAPGGLQIIVTITPPKQGV
jgi:hypothetical protein